LLKKQKAAAHVRATAFQEKLAATYSRGVYKTTTIGKTAFDGRVRNGNGSDHSFMATKKCNQYSASANARPQGLGTTKLNSDKEHAGWAIL
jgi:hypothetical protein